MRKHFYYYRLFLTNSKDSLLAVWVKIRCISITDGTVP